jgi:hypothetical protein
MQPFFQGRGSPNLDWRENTKKESPKVYSVLLAVDLELLKSCNTKRHMILVMSSYLKPNDKSFIYLAISVIRCLNIARRVTFQQSKRRVGAVWSSGVNFNSENKTYHTSRGMPILDCDIYIIYRFR